jgi:hypothetical protein
MHNEGPATKKLRAHKSKIKGPQIEIKDPQIEKSRAHKPKSKTPSKMVT